MKKIILVAGMNLGQNDLANLYKIKKDAVNHCEILHLKEHRPVEVLAETLAAIRKETERGYQDILVIYMTSKTCGSFDLFKDNIPCDKLDIALLRTKLIEAVGGEDTPQQKYMFDALYLPGIINLCRT